MWTLWHSCQKIINEYLKVHEAVIIYIRSSSKKNGCPNLIYHGSMSMLRLFSLISRTMIMCTFEINGAFFHDHKWPVRKPEDITAMMSFSKLRITMLSVPAFLMFQVWRWLHNNCTNSRGEPRPNPCWELLQARFSRKCAEGEASQHAAISAPILSIIPG